MPSCETSDRGPLPSPTSPDEPLKSLLLALLHPKVMPGTRAWQAGDEPNVNVSVALKPDVQPVPYDMLYGHSHPAQWCTRNVVELAGLYNGVGCGKQRPSQAAHCVQMRSLAVSKLAG